jgi:hypothetical protein
MNGPQTGSNVKIFNNYVFDKTNGYSLLIPAKYTSYGFITAIVNCSNPVSSSVTKATVRIGANLNAATGSVLNYYANINELVFFNLKIAGGNGYEILLDFNDNNPFTLPWSFISTNGTNLNELSSQKTGLRNPKVAFSKNNIQIMYMYSKPGDYEPVLTVSNPFSSIPVRFCSKVYIKNSRVDKSNSQDQNCVIKSENMNLYLNGASLLVRNASYNLARGIRNVFGAELDACNDTSALQAMRWSSYWSLSRLNYVKGVLESEELLEKYCFVSSSDRAFSLEANELDFGNYSLKGYVFERAEPENFVYLASYVLKIGATPLSVNLNDGQRNIELNEDESFKLSYYDKTFDPDAKDRRDKANFEFYFVCVEGGDSPSRGDLIRAAQNKARSLEFDFESLGFSLMLNRENKIKFYEKGCFKPSVNESYEQLVVSEASYEIEIQARDLFLNVTASVPISLQLVVRKLGRVSLSQQLMVQMNMSSVIFVPDASDFAAMSEQLNKLEDLAKSNPKGALRILDSFVSAINSKADEDVANYNQVRFFFFSFFFLFFFGCFKFGMLKCSHVHL